MIRIAVATLVLLLSGAAGAQENAAPAAPAASGEAPNFSMQPVEGGVLRLDTRSGAMSFCANRSGMWRCEALPDERAALEAEIARLRDRLAAANGGAGVPDIMAPPRAPGAPGTPDASPPDAGAPTAPDNQRGFDAAMDEAMRKAEAMLRRFHELIERLRSDPPPGEKL